MMKKSLLNDLIWGVVVTNKGLSIEFRLKHGLNSNGFLSAHSTSPKVAGSVIDLSAHRPSNSSPADASADFHNVEIQKLQVVKNGRSCAKVVEPAGLAVSREYEIPWKKQTLDIAELARLRFEEGLGSRQICRRMGIPRTTAITAVHRLERERGLR